MLFYLYYSFIYVGRNSLVYMPTGYGLDGPGIESFGAHSAFYMIYRFFPRRKAAGLWC